MNDRFEHMSDGSYAWGARQTYLRELEMLDIAVPDLMIGICLRADNAGENHYFGSVGRVGRALSESADAGEVEGRLLDMIRDPGLDNLNRLWMIYLFRIYCSYLPEEMETVKLEPLQEALEALPEYMGKEIRLEE